MNWSDILTPEVEKEYFVELMDFLKEEYSKNNIVPEQENMFKAFQSVPYEDIKVVILGQDPYPGRNQATGIAFAVEQKQKIPKSLLNIFKEVENEYHHFPKDKTLLSWTKQGVFLLNTTLTVRLGKAGSHRGKGWEQFTDHIIQKIAEKEDPVVFMLWGNAAKEKEPLIVEKSSKHLILKTSHPSPLSAYRGFNGCGHFKKANDFIKEHYGKKERIIWF